MLLGGIATNATVGGGAVNTVGLKAYYNAHPAARSGSTWLDESGNSNTGTLLNFLGDATSGWQGAGTAEDPYVLRFNGTDNKVRIPSAATGSLDITGDISICALIKPTQNGDDGAYHAVVAKRNGIGGNCVYEMFLAATSAKSGWFSKNSEGFTLEVGDTVVSKNAWQFLCITVSSDTITHYRNGVADGSRGLTRREGSANYDVFIGDIEETNREPFAGDMSALLIYNRALSAEEIEQLFDSLRSRVGL